MAGLTVSTTLSPGVQAYYDKKWLMRAKMNLVGYQFAQKRKLPLNNGKTAYFMRYTPLTKNTTALTETVDGGISVATRQQLNVEETSATVALYGDFVTISKMASLTSIDPDISQKVDLLGQQAGESIDTIILEKLNTGLMTRRADADASYQVNGTADSGSTTTLVDDALTQADDYWNGGYITFTSGKNYGETRQVTDFTASSDTVTFSPALPYAVDSTSKYRLTVGTGIAAGDVLTSTNLRLTLRDLKRNKAMKADNNAWCGLIDTDIEFDFMNDDLWKNAATYKDSVNSLYSGELGSWMGIRFVSSQNIPRETVAGVISDTGDVHNAYILGRECYGVVDLEGQKQKIYVKTPDQLGQPIPLYGSCGWEAGFTAKVLNGCFGVKILCGASA